LQLVVEPRYVFPVLQSKDLTDAQNLLKSNGLHFLSFALYVLLIIIFRCRGVHPLSQWSPISAKFINWLTIFAHVRCFAQFTLFCFPLFWPWCIYASCFTRTGRLSSGVSREL